MANKRTQKVHKSSFNLIEGPVTTLEKKERKMTLKEIDADSLYQVQFIKTRLIIESEENKYELSNIEELAESIAKFALLSPVNVREKNDGTYELFAGHRRKKAYELIYDIYKALIENDEEIDVLHKRFIDNDAADSWETIVGAIQENQDRFSEFNCIPAIVFPSEMTDDEVWSLLNDANILARHLTIDQTMKHIGFFLTHVPAEAETLKEKANFIFKKFNKLGFKEWKEGQISVYIAVYLNGTDAVKEALMNGILSVKNARFLSTFDPATQDETIEILKTNPKYIEEMKIEEKEKRIKAKSRRNISANAVPVKPQKIEKIMLDFNKTLVKLKAFNNPATKLKPEEREKISEMRKNLLDLRSDIYDTMNRINILLEESEN